MANASAPGEAGRSSHPPPDYDADSLVVYSKEVGFLRDPRFQAAYRRGMDSGHHIAREPGSDDDIHIEWRVHVLLWAASHAARLPGDFVECGVNTGIFSLAVCDYLDFNATGKSFWLFDTFAGIPLDQVSERERELGRSVESENESMFSECYKLARANFAQFPRAHLVRGRVPQTLATVDIGRVAYLSIDMNIAEPEVAALKFFWDKLSPGAPVIFDDYGWSPYLAQKEALDALAAELGVSILELPTGQGLLLKPPIGKRHTGSSGRRLRRDWRAAIRGLIARRH
jgi:O-methyltransferase